MRLIAPALNGVAANDMGRCELLQSHLARQALQHCTRVCIKRGDQRRLVHVSHRRLQESTSSAVETAANVTPTGPHLSPPAIEPCSP